MEQAEEFLPSQAFGLREKRCRPGTSAPGYLSRQPGGGTLAKQERPFYWMSEAEAPAMSVKQLIGNREGGKLNHS